MLQRLLSRLHSRFSLADLRSRLTVYAVAPAAVFIATLTRAALGPLLEDDIPFITYFPAVLVAAWAGGLRAAVAAVILSALAATYWFIPPERSVTITAHRDQISLVVFVIVGCATGVLAQTRRAAATAAVRGERRYRELWEQSTEARYILDLSGRFIDVNPAAEVLTGYSREELLARSLVDLLEPEQHAWSRQMLDRKLTGEPVTTYELDVRTRDGRIRTMEVTSRLVHPAHGVPEIHGSARDITQRKAAEAGLRQSEERLALAAQSAGFGFYDDRGPGQVYWSQEMRALFGLPADIQPEEGARTALTLIHPDDRARWQRALDAARDPEGSGRMDTEHRVIRPDGRTVWVAQRGRILFEQKGSERRRVRAIGIVADITARKEAELRVAALQRLAGAFARALTPADVAGVVLREGLAELGAEAAAIVVKEGDGLRMVGAGGAAAEMLAASESIPLDSPLPLAVAVRRRQPVWLADPEDRQDHRPLDAAHGGAVGPGRGAGVPLMVDDRVIGALGLSFRSRGAFAESEQAFLLAVADACAQALERARLFEVERTARAEAQTAARVREEFVAAVSHDLRTPLSTILGVVQLLSRRLGRIDGPEAGRAVTQLSLIEQAAQRMNRMVAELLDVARLEAGRPLELRRQAMDLITLAQRLAAEHQRSTSAHQIRMAATAAEVTGTWDRDRLERVVSNLLSNAIKYSPEGGEVRIAITEYTSDAGEPWAELTVIDQGLGIPAADLPRIFERFHRAANVADRVSGTGLGLAGVKQIIEQHGGTVSLRSEEGTGTTVSLRLPREWQGAQCRGVEPVSAACSNP